MAAKDPSEIDTVDVTSYAAADGTFQADLLSQGTDDNTTQGINSASISKIGKQGFPHGDILRVIFADGLAGLADGDTITLYISSIHATSNLNILAYTSTSAVTATEEIQISISTGANVFTLTTAFIGQLGDLGSGAWGVRIANTAWGSGGGGDIQIAEVDADISSGVAVLDQDGFQFINDDGSESAATDIAAEDTNITRDADENTRLRIQVDTTGGDPDAATRTLQYKEVADSANEWRDVPLT